MKKLGIVLLALALCGGFLAAEKATWSVEGWAKTEWGFKFATEGNKYDKTGDWDTGFLTEAGASLKIVFLGETSRVGEGVGNWRGYIELNDFAIDNLQDSDDADADSDIFGDHGDEDDAMPGISVTMPEVTAKILYKDFLYFLLTSTDTTANYAEEIDDLTADIKDLSTLGIAGEYPFAVKAMGDEVKDDATNGGIEVGLILENAGTLRFGAATATTWKEFETGGKWSYYSFKLAYDGVAIADFFTPNVAVTWNNGRYAGIHLETVFGLPVLAGMEITLGSDFLMDFVNYQDNDKKNDELLWGVDASLEVGLQVAEGFSVGAGAYMSRPTNFEDSIYVKDGIFENIVLDAGVEIEEASGDEGLIPVLGMKVEAGFANLLNIENTCKALGTKQFPWQLFVEADATFGDFEIKAGYEFTSDSAEKLKIDEEKDYLQVTYSGIDKTEIYAKYELDDVANIKKQPGAVWVGAKVTF